MATCDLPSAASRWGAPRAFGQRGSAKRRTQKGCAQHKRAREHRARARGGLGCGRVRTRKQEVDRDVDVDVGEDHAQRVHLEDDLGARLLDQEVLGYLPGGGLGFRQRAAALPETRANQRESQGSRDLQQLPPAPSTRTQAHPISSPGISCVPLKAAYDISASSKA